MTMITNTEERCFTKSVYTCVYEPPTAWVGILKEIPSRVKTIEIETLKLNPVSMAPQSDLDHHLSSINKSLNMGTKRIGIIGGGVSGLLAIKTCKEYGLEPVCFEKYHDIGGLWHYKPESSWGEASVMKSTIINTSKEAMAFSDFPPAPHYPNYMHNRWVLQYFREYAEHFDCLPHVQFETEVKLVKKAADYAKSGKWDIVFCGKNDTEDRTETFDGVMLCSGHHAFPHQPSFLGLDKFKGNVTHSSLYKEPKGQYSDQSVLVVGIGNSGGDIAAELGRNGCTKQVYLSTRHGTWINNRVGPNGLPGDIVFLNRVTKFLLENSFWLANYLVTKKIQSACDHDLYGLRPAHKPLQQHPFVQDDLPNRILSGGIIVKPNLREFDENGVTFEDGTHEQVDSVILCTGFSIGYPFLEEGVIPVSENQVNLFKYMYQPNLAHPSTLAVIGLIQPYGAIMPIAEMQCRIFASAIAGETKLPKQAEMVTDVIEKRDAMAARYVASRRHTIQVDWIPFMDELAAILGSSPPNPLDIAFKDPTLAWNLATGPTMPYVYRLQGPHSWSKARETLLSVMDRVKAPLRPVGTGVKMAGSHSGSNNLLKDGYLRVVVAVVLLYYLWQLLFG